MKKKQRDDVMGEDESSLPINDGESGRRPACRAPWLMCHKYLVAAPGVSRRRLISINCKPGVPMSHQRLSTNVLHVGSNGANTKRWFGSERLMCFGVFQWEHGQGIREHWDGYGFQTRVELQVAFHRNLNPIGGANKASILLYESKFGRSERSQPSFLACLRFARSL
jgi:hypothetical protein